MVFGAGEGNRTLCFSVSFRLKLRRSGISRFITCPFRRNTAQ